MPDNLQEQCHSWPSCMLSSSLPSTFQTLSHFSLPFQTFPSTSSQILVACFSIYPELSRVRVSSRIHLIALAMFRMSVLNIVANAMAFFEGDQITKVIQVATCLTVRVRVCVCVCAVCVCVCACGWVDECVCVSTHAHTHTFTFIM